MFQPSMHIEWDSTKNAYTATFPDLPGVNGYGNTYDEAARECREIFDKLTVSAKERGDEPSQIRRKTPFDWIGREVRACNELVGEGYYKFASDWYDKHNGNEDGMVDAWLLSKDQETASSENESTPEARN